MNANIGHQLNITINGESHSERISVILRGLPVGGEFIRSSLDDFLARRVPGYCFESEALNAISRACATERKEADRLVFDRGVLEDGDCCTIIADEIEAHIDNVDAKPCEYKEIRKVLRPGHADLGAWLKYGEDGLKTGGGQFSGRMTAMLCAAGGIAVQLLEQLGIVITARIDEISGISYEEDNLDSIDAIMGAIADASSEGDSLGGVVKLTVEGYPGGIGGAMLEGLDGELAKAMFAIPAVKGFESGSGFYGSRLKGSQNNDEYYLNEGRIVSDSNRQGGISGGISTGMDICCRVAFKPIPSIAKAQHSVDVTEMKETIIETKGRHDVCCVPRVLPVVEAMAALVLFDKLR